MSRHYYDTLGQTTPVFYPVGYTFGVGYKDECTTLNLDVFVQCQPTRPFQYVPGRPRYLEPLDAQPDADD